MESSFSLPFPPSVNNYFTVVRGRKIKSARARNYCIEAQAQLIVQWVPRFSGKLGIEIEVAEPDARRRDLDNLLKGILDSLSCADRIDDDSNFDKISISRRGKETGGKVFVRMWQIGVDDMDTA